MSAYTTTAMFCRIHRTCATYADRCDMFDSIEFTETAASVGLDVSMLVCAIIPVHIIECHMSST